MKRGEIMESNDIVKLLRGAAPVYENKEIHLPIELINVINGKKPEKGWKTINASKVIRYIADMMEE